MGDFTGLFTSKFNQEILPSATGIPPGDSVGRELVLCGALESDDGLGVAVGHAVGVVAPVVLVAVRLAALAGSLVGSAVSALEEGGLAALADGVDSELIEASGRGDGGVVVGAGRFTVGVAAVDGPVVVAVVVDVAMAVVGQAVLADLLRQSPILALV